LELTRSAERHAQVPATPAPLSLAKLWRIQPLRERGLVLHDGALVVDGGGGGGGWGKEGGGRQSTLGPVKSDTHLEPVLRVDRVHALPASASSDTARAAPPSKRPAAVSRGHSCAGTCRGTAPSSAEGGGWACRRCTLSRAARSASPCSSWTRLARRRRSAHVSGGGSPKTSSYARCSSPRGRTGRPRSAWKHSQEHHGKYVPTRILMHSLPPQPEEAILTARGQQSTTTAGKP
jgi:hypothetical protein